MPATRCARVRPLPRPHPRVKPRAASFLVLNVSILTDFLLLLLSSSSFPPDTRPPAQHQPPTKLPHSRALFKKSADFQKKQKICNFCQIFCSLFFIGVLLFLEWLFSTFIPAQTLNDACFADLAKTVFPARTPTIIKLSGDEVRAQRRNGETFVELPWYVIQ